MLPWFKRQRKYINIYISVLLLSPLDLCLMTNCLLFLPRILDAVHVYTPGLKDAALKTGWLSAFSWRFEEVQTYTGGGLPSAVQSSSTVSLSSLMSSISFSGLWKSGGSDEKNNNKDLTLIAIKCRHYWVLLTLFTYIELQCWELQTELLEEVEVLLLPVPAVLHTCIELHYQLCLGQSARWRTPGPVLQGITLRTSGCKPQFFLCTIVKQGTGQVRRSAPHTVAGTLFLPPLDCCDSLNLWTHCLVSLHEDNCKYKQSHLMEVLKKHISLDQFGPA